MKNQTRCVLLICIATSAALFCFAQRAAQIHYQGRLLDTNGAPVNGNVDVDVALYTNAVAGSAAYSQHIGVVTSVNGMFSFPFGTNDLEFLSVFTNTEVWVEVEIDGDVLTPRQELMSVPYALYARRVYNLSVETTETIVGVEAKGERGGVAIGYQANTYDAMGVGGGTALGHQTEGYTGGSAVGYDAKAFNYGVAVGYQASGYNYGTAVGYNAFATKDNVAIGSVASANGTNRTAIGPSVSSAADDSTTVRGSLYIDGAEGVYHRPTFGTGDWEAGLPGGWSGIITNVNGTTTQLLHYNSGILTDVVIEE